MDEAQTRPAGFSPLTAIAFTVNYVMGTGFLTLPSAFHSAGTVLSLVTLLFCALVSDISKDYVLSAMARAEAIKAKKEDVETSLLEIKCPDDEGNGEGDDGFLLVKSRKFEVVEICSMVRNASSRCSPVILIG